MKLFTTLFGFAFFFFNSDAQKSDVGTSEALNFVNNHILTVLINPHLPATASTRQGTGLGLSLSYDIIKAHGGEIKVETREGEGE